MSDSQDWSADGHRYHTNASPWGYHRDDNSLRLVLQVAAGVALGFLIVWIGYTAYIEWRAREVAAELQQVAKQIQEESQRQLLRSRVDQFAREQRARHAELQAEQQRRKALAEQQFLASEAKRQAVQESTRKEDAWARYYRKPAHCENPAPEALTECANHFIRAKREFEAKYAAGRL